MTRSSGRLLAAAVIAAGISCHPHLPAWSGRVPPVVPRQDLCGSGEVTREGAAKIHRLPYLQRAERDGVTVAWAGLPEDAPRVVVAAAEDATRATITEVAGQHPGPAGDERARRHELYEEYNDRGDRDDRDDDDDDDADDDADDDGDGGDTEKLEADKLYMLAARVAGLDPGERYCYRVESDRGPLTDWATLTLAPPPDPDRVDRFVVVGDSGTGSAAQLALARRITNVPMDAILFLGDIAYKRGTHEQLQTRFFDVYSGLIQRVPVYSAIGNHEIRTQGGRPFEEVFVFPGNERWYSFQLGDVHFVVLDTTQLGRAQATWLDQDLASASRRFTVVLAHHPPFTGAWRGPSRGFRRWFVPILERHDVDLVLSGHEHHYERSRPIGGIHYIVSGGGGGRLSPPGISGHTKLTRAVHHFLTLAVTRDALVLRAIDIHGLVFDELVIPAGAAQMRTALGPDRR